MLRKILPRENRNAIVKSKIPKAHGLILSINAATETSGSNHVPPPLKSQRVVVPTFPTFIKITEPNNKTAIAIRIPSFLLILFMG
jgi:hypothetical protein